MAISRSQINKSVSTGTKKKSDGNFTIERERERAERIINSKPYEPKFKNLPDELGNKPKFKTMPDRTRRSTTKDRISAFNPKVKTLK